MARGVGQGRAVFDSERQASEIIQLIMAHYTHVLRRLGRPRTYAPLFDEDTDGTVLWETVVRRLREGIYRSLRLVSARGEQVGALVWAEGVECGATAFQSACFVRLAALRRFAFSFEKANSMGFRSGE